jgi:hypothetical protein
MRQYGMFRRILSALVLLAFFAGLPLQASPLSSDASATHVLTASLSGALMVINGVKRSPNHCRAQAPAIIAPAADFGVGESGFAVVSTADASFLNVVYYATSPRGPPSQIHLA